jgi:hypothetical protein
MHATQWPWRTDRLPRTLLACLLIAVAAHIVSSQSSAAQSAGSAWQSGGQGDRQEQSGRDPSNTTVVPRSSAEPKANPNIGEVSLAAFLTDEGQRIEQGLVWRVFAEPAANEARPKLLSTSREASPTVKLPPGSYAINAAFGRAHLTRKIKVEGGTSTQERFVLNAGGLRVNAVVGNGEAAPERSVSYDVLSGETDQLGNRSKIMSGARTGIIVRLNAGIYQIVSTYGDANATVKADVTVEAGKLTEATVAHQGARVTFKLVTRAGGEAQADTQWSVHTTHGDLVKESAGALPTHILGPGSYIVTAKNGGRSFRRAFTVQSGETAQIEVAMQ